MADQTNIVKVRVTLGDALIDLEVSRDDLAPVVSELAEQFRKKNLVAKISEDRDR